MKKLLLLACFTLLISIPPALADEKETGTTLEISAEAKTKAVPDIATISAGVINNAPVAAKALEQNTLKMNEVFKALKAAGIAEKDIQTSGINIGPQYDYSQPNKAPRITSYQVSNTVSVILRDIRNTGAVLDALVAEGANQINGPQFSVENTDAALDGARQEAVAKARKRAQLYAEAAGLTIRRIVSISEQAGYTPGPHPMMMRAMAMDGAESAPTPVAAGDVDLSITVHIKFELGK